MSVKVMSWVWDHSQAKGIDRLVLLAIADSANDDGGNAWPSIATIARKCGGVSTRTVQRSVQALIDMGELQMTSVGSGRKSSVYKVKMQQGRQNVTPAKVSPLTISHPRQDVTPAVTESHLRGDVGVTQSVLDPSLNHPKTSAAPRLTDLDGKFDQFWAIYPRREAKAGAKAKFVSALRRGVELETILAGARRYRDDPNREPQFTKHPTTWLNNGCWDDEPLPARESARASAAPAPRGRSW